jgi:hypothetical protein
MLSALEAIKPWRFTGGEVTRDVWRVRVVSLFLPWILSSWRRRTPELAKLYLNQPLMQALQALKTKPIIVTAGFLPIVSPLVAAIGLPDVKIVASRGSGFADRRNGKLMMATEVLGAETVSKSLVITDSEQDSQLLAASARPLLTTWPEARFRRALSGIYLPGEYLSQVKRPGERYIFRGILQEDFALWVLSTVALAAFPLTHIAGLAFLLLSFWAIYERGYVDNDIVASKYETDPKLTASFHTSTVATPMIQPWIWACISGAAGVFLLRYPHAPAEQDFAAWLGVLVATYVCFWVYNRMDKNTRVWMFPMLQFARSAAPVALVAVGPIGAIGLGAQVLSRWVPYYLYRAGMKDWPKAHTHLIRVLFFVVLAIMLAAAEGWRAVINWTSLGLLLWSLFRARDELVDVVRSAGRIDHPPATP